MRARAILMHASRNKRRTITAPTARFPVTLRRGNDNRRTRALGHTCTLHGIDLNCPGEKKNKGREMQKEKQGKWPHRSVTCNYNAACRHVDQTRPQSPVCSFKNPREGRERERERPNREFRRKKLLKSVSEKLNSVIRAREPCGWKIRRTHG